MILFYFSEALRSISSAKTSFVLTIISLTISVVLILFSVITLQVTKYYTSGLKSDIKINLIIKDSADENDKEKILSVLKEKKYLNKIEFISKEKAAEQFIQETGEDFRKILDYNPLPESYSVRISTEYADTNSLKNILKDLSSIEMVDDVVFKEGFIYDVLNYINAAQIYLFIITIIVCVIAVYLVYATVRTIIHSRMNEFETMKLVGAKLSTIKIPVILNGLLAGLISGILALLIFKYFLGYISSFSVLVKILNENILYYFLIMFLVGPVLSFLVSIFTLRKVSLKI
jgi:cell division transport system permease protein